MEFSTIEAFIRAANPDQAEERFLEAVSDERRALLMTVDLDASEVEIVDVENVTSSHDPVPQAGDPLRCLLCDRPARWTGTSGEASPTGKLIPGIWVHQANPYVEAGIGL